MGSPFAAGDKLIQIDDLEPDASCPRPQLSSSAIVPWSVGFLASLLTACINNLRAVIIPRKHRIMRSKPTGRERTSGRARRLGLILLP